MKINNIRINGFGNLEDKDIELKNGINLIYGKNEAGKSTLLKFIYCTLYGASRNKNGKEISDYEKYMPWSGNEYSGKINYELDNNEKYEVFRDFNKKNPKIYNENLEDISKTFSINKTKGIEFFYDQTKIDEELFKSTVLVEQGESKLDKPKQHTLIQKITNLVSTGNDNISYKKAVEKLNKKLIEEVGTDRTVGRPINIIEEKIEKLENAKLNIENNKSEIEYLEKENKNIKEEIIKQENKINLIKRIKLKTESEKLETEKINTNKKIKEELEENINKLKIEIENQKIEKINTNKIKYILIILLAIISGIIYFIINNTLLLYLIVACIVILMGIGISDTINKNKVTKKINEEKRQKKSQIKMIEENKEKLEKNINELMNENRQYIETNKANIRKEFSLKLPQYEIENILDKNYEELLIELEKEENKFTTLKLKESTLNIEKNKMKVNTEELEQIEKQIEETIIEKQKIKSLENSIKITREALEIAYEKAKKNITPKFSAKLAECISKISTEKYQTVNFSDENGLRIELKNGDYIPVENLSTGTIDQMYLALRINSITEIVEEKLPIILDEAFAYYDDERMENILKYIQEEYKNNQVLIFTCSDREQKILEETGIGYNKVQI